MEQAGRVGLVGVPALYGAPGLAAVEEELDGLAEPVVHGIEAHEVSLVAPGRGQVALVARFWAVGRSRAGAAIGIPAPERASLYPVLVVTVKSSKWARTPWPNRRSDVGMDTLSPQAAIVTGSSDPPGQTSNHPH